MYKYEIALRNEKEKTYFIISCILLFSNFILLLSLTISQGFTNWWPFILSLSGMFSFFIGWYFKRPGVKQSLYVPFLFFSLAWFFTPFLWLGFVNLFFDVLDAVSRRKLTVLFSENKILYPSAFNKSIDWAAINNIILKDGMLTIDLKNNKLIQQYMDERNTTINEKEFNDFCKERLKSEV